MRTVNRPISTEGSGIFLNDLAICFVYVVLTQVLLYPSLPDLKTSVEDISVSVDGKDRDDDVGVAEDSALSEVENVYVNVADSDIPIENLHSYIQDKTWESFKKEYAVSFIRRMY